MLLSISAVEDVLKIGIKEQVGFQYQNGLFKLQIDLALVPGTVLMAAIQILSCYWHQFNGLSPEIASAPNAITLTILQCRSRSCHRFVTAHSGDVLRRSSD